jgi:hypothetical protein
MICLQDRCGTGINKGLRNRILWITQKRSYVAMRVVHARKDMIVVILLQRAENLRGKGNANGAKVCLLIGACQPNHLRCVIPVMIPVEIRSDTIGRSFT